MEHFSGFTDYFRFALGKEFAWKDAAAATSFKYTKNRYEKLGHLLAKPILQPIDFSLRNGRNPLFITAMTVGAICITTLLFYPWVIAGVFTPIVAISMKAAAFAVVQSTIAGIGLRTLGRLGNQELMEKWDQGCLQPRSMGSLRI